MANRNHIAARVARSGGVQAPRRAAGGPTTGLGRARPALPIRQGIGPGKPAPKGQAGGPPGPQPAAAVPAPAPAPMPWDVGYASAINAGNQRFANRQLDFNSRRQIAGQDFGIGAGGAIDYDSNPYSRAALLRKAFDASVRGTRNTAGRSIYSGSYENAQRYNTSNFNQAGDQLGREYRAAISDIDREELGAQEERERDAEEAGWRRLEAASEGEPPPGGAPPGKGKAGGGSYRGKGKNRYGIGRGKKAR